jgi:hypothetical protein
MTSRTTSTGPAVRRLIMRLAGRRPCGLDVGFAMTAMGTPVRVGVVDADGAFKDVLVRRFATIG